MNIAVAKKSNGSSNEPKMEVKKGEPVVENAVDNPAQTLPLIPMKGCQ